MKVSEAGSRIGRLESDACRIEGERESVNWAGELSGLEGAQKISGLRM